MVASEASMAEELGEKKQQKSNCIISLPLSIPPFVKPQKSNLQADFHNSIVSTAENCLRFLNSLVVSHPLFNKVHSFSSHFQHICQLQVQRRTYQNMGNLSHHSFAAVFPGDSVAGIVAANGVLNFLNIYNTLLVVRLVLTWFPSAPQAVVSPLSTLCDPYLNIFRGIIPPLGGTLDLSPILAFLVLNAFTSAATALPAELPSTLTTSQKKWMTRLSGNKSKTADGDN